MVWNVACDLNHGNIPCIVLAQVKDDEINHKLESGNFKKKFLVKLWSVVDLHHFACGIYVHYIFVI